RRALGPPQSRLWAPAGGGGGGRLGGGAWRERVRLRPRALWPQGTCQVRAAGPQKRLRISLLAMRHIAAEELWVYYYSGGLKNDRTLSFLAAWRVPPRGGRRLL